MDKILLNDSRISIETAFDEFVYENELKNLAEDTVIYYDKCITYFYRFLDEQGLHKSMPCNVIKQSLLDSYNMYLRKKLTNEVTVNTRLRGIRTFVNFLQSRQYISSCKVKMLKCDKKVKTGYNNDELALLLKKPDIKKCSFIEYRNWAIINFLYVTRCKIINGYKYKNIGFGF